MCQSFGIIHEYFMLMNNTKNRCTKLRTTKINVFIYLMNVNVFIIYVNIGVTAMPDEDWRRWILAVLIRLSVETTKRTRGVTQWRFWYYRLGKKKREGGSTALHPINTCKFELNLSNLMCSESCFRGIEPLVLCKKLFIVCNFIYVYIVRIQVEGWPTSVKNLIASSYKNKRI